MSKAFDMRSINHFLFAEYLVDISIQVKLREVSGLGAFYSAIVTTFSKVRLLGGGRLSAGCLQGN